MTEDDCQRRRTASASKHFAADRLNAPGYTAGCAPTKAAVNLTSPKGISATVRISRKERLWTNAE